MRRLPGPRLTTPRPAPLSRLCALLSLLLGGLVPGGWSAAQTAPESVSTFSVTRQTARFSALRPVPLQMERPDLPGPVTTSPVLSPDPGFTFGDLFSQFPADYTGRFGSVAGVFLPGYGYGARGIPLPFRYDFRVTYVLHPLYTEYGVYGRLFDTTVALGRFQNDDSGATQGVGHAEVTHDPDTGVQAGALLQDQGRSSKVSAGYAWRLGETRLLADAGYAVQGDVDGYYLHGSVSRSHTFEERGDFGLLRLTPGATLRTYIYPLNLSAQTSADLSASVNYRPTPDLSVNLFQFERFVTGFGGPDGEGSGVPDFNLTRYSQSSLDAYYTPPARYGPLEFRGAQYHLTRIWLDHYFSINELSATGRVSVVPAVALDLTPRYDFSLHDLGLRGSLLLRLDAVPIAFGPSFEYVFNPLGNRYSFGLVFAGK